MKITYKTEPLVYVECASLLTQLFYKRSHPEDAEASYDPEEVFAGLSERHQIPVGQFARFVKPLSALYRDIEREAENISKEDTAFFFSSETESIGSVGIRLALILERKYRLRSVPDEKARETLRFHIGRLMLEGNDDDDGIRDGDMSESAFISSLEQSNETAEARWKALMVWRHADEYLDRLEMILEAPVRVYLKHLPALQPLFDESITLMKKNLADDAKKALSERYFLHLDIDELTIYPQAAVILGASLWVLDDSFAVENMLLIGCCFEQSRSLLFGSEKRIAELSVQIKALDDKQRLKILAALCEKPLCGQEICTLTGLSAATVSHHMNTLISGSFVTIEKVGTRINYRQAPDKVKAFLRELERFLLKE